MSKEKLIPELRFPEFKNEGEWEEDMVYNLVFTITPPKKITSSNYQKYGKFPIIDQSKNYYCGWTNDNEAVITEDLPLIIFGDHTCVIKIAKKPFAQGADGIKILKTKDKIFPEYLFHYLCHNEVVMEDYKRHYSILKDKVIVFPNINSGEQQRIASCLSSLDEVIEAHSKKLELLKDHKKGLLQNLFPQDGEKVPKLRFKEFENSGEWEEKKLGEVGEIITGNTPSTTNSENYNGSKLFVSPSDINENRYITQTQTTLSDIGFSKTRHIQANSVLFVCIGSTIGKVAQNKVECATNQQINSIVPFSDYCSDFLFSVLECFAKQIAELAGIQAVPIINKTQFSSIKLFFPKPKEQQKIASCFSSLDEIIEAQAEKIEQLKLHKKGLMQGLFPKTIMN